MVWRIFFMGVIGGGGLCAALKATDDCLKDAPAPVQPFGLTGRTQDDIGRLSAIIRDYPFDFLEEMSQSAKKNLCIEILSFPLTMDEIRHRTQIIHHNYTTAERRNNFFNCTTYFADRVYLLESLLLLDTAKLTLLRDNLEVFYRGAFDIGFNLSLFQTIQWEDIGWMQRKIGKRPRDDGLSKENIPPPSLKRHRPNHETDE